MTDHDLLAAGQGRGGEADDPGRMEETASQEGNFTALRCSENPLAVVNAESRL